MKAEGRIQSADKFIEYKYWCRALANITPEKGRCFIKKKQTKRLFHNNKKLKNDIWGTPK